MISVIKKSIISIAEIIHLKLFQHEMSDQMSKFLRHLSWSIVGGITASVVMMAVNIIAGRLMGPDEYGRYSLLITIAQITIIPMLFGLDVSSVIAISKSKDNDERRGNISSTLYFVIFSALLLSILFVLFLPYLSQRFALGKTFFIVTFVFALLTGFKIILDAFIRGLHLFKYQFYGKISETVIVGILFGMFFGLGNKHDYLNYAYCLIGGAIVLIVYNLKKIIHSLSGLNIGLLKKQLSLGKILFLGTVLGVGFNSIDKLIVVKYLNFTDLGVYSAYFMVSVNLVAQLSQMFINVFLPSISSIDNDAFVKKINKLYLLGFFPIFVLLAGVIFLAIKLFGDRYGINYGLIVSFSLFSTLIIYSTINSAIITAISKEAYKQYLVYLNSVNLLHIFAYGMMIYFKVVSIQLLVVLYIINVMICIIVQKRLIRFSFVPNDLTN